MDEKPMLESTRRQKQPVTHQTSLVELRPDRPRIGSNYRAPPDKWHITIPDDQLWIQKLFWKFK
ncbi:MAG: hypothetical protein EBS73_17150 [Betaproteobacteria bacterium]|nr:hypothetical protein [Betaproteobacteria bacterium]